MDGRHFNNESNNFLKSQTPSHVGPGSNYNQDIESVRNGWRPERMPKRQPMDSNTNRGLHRGDSYINNTLTKDGYIVHKDTRKEKYPAAGQYDRLDLFSPVKPKNSAVPAKIKTSPGVETYMGTKASRSQHCHLHNGVLLTSSPRELQRQTTLGPGSYFANDDADSIGGYSNNSLIKKSYNRRASGGNEKGYNQSNTNTPNQRSRSAGRLRPKSVDTSNSYFKRYTAENLKSPPSPILQSPSHRVSQHNYKYSDDNGCRDFRSQGHSPSTPYVVSPKRGIPIGRVYH